VIELIDLETVRRNIPEEKSTDKIDLNKYKDFVQEVTSAESNNSSFMSERLKQLEFDSKTNMALLMTGAIGIASEGGEFAEIIKKCVFQGKPMDDDTKYHIKRELGDIIWYWINSCRALDLDPNEVIKENVNKLKARYPGGEFDVHYSENRKQGDL
jgi:NTP pyrophosphatase (non-canonical NTP hydrolase)|tara:strand:- start:3133 stop:3600 length:468 start_codon:yes stop_codon:yes gene_type:complete